MDNLFAAAGTICLSKVALAAGTTSTLSTTGTTVYAVRGKAFSKAALVNQPTPVLDAQTGLAFVPFAANNGAVVLVGFDTLGNLKAAQSPVYALDVAGNFAVPAPYFPTMPDNIAPVGYIVIKAGATAVGNYVFGTSNLSAVTGVTFAFQDLITVTDRPQVA